jgi:hypothetical protein
MGNILKQYFIVLQLFFITLLSAQYSKNFIQLAPENHHQFIESVTPFLQAVNFTNSPEKEWDPKIEIFSIPESLPCIFLDNITFNPSLSIFSYHVYNHYLSIIPPPFFSIV